VKPRKQAIQLRIEVDVLVKGDGVCPNIEQAFRQPNLRRSLDLLLHQAVPSTVVGVAITKITMTGESR
jgi:hypothetical protein